MSSINYLLDRFDELEQKSSALRCAIEDIKLDSESDPVIANHLEILSRTHADVLIQLGEVSDEIDYRYSHLDV